MCVGHDTQKQESESESLAPRVLQQQHRNKENQGQDEPQRHQPANQHFLKARNKFARVGSINVERAQQAQVRAEQQNRQDGA